MAFIEARDIHFTYNLEGELPLEVLHGVDLDVDSGEFVALLGHNGCGKSTMAFLMNGMLIPTKGTLTVNGIPTTDENRILDIRRHVGLVQQNPDNQIVASIVEEDVAFGPENLGVPPDIMQKRVDDALKAVDMYDYKDHAPDKLSGGQKQRIAIAGVLAMEPSCIVLDEPTAMLDPRGRREVMETIQRFNREKGITIVLITHYMDEAVLADRVVVMEQGDILKSGSPKEIFSQVEFLKRHQLDVPQATELTYRLKSSGIQIPDLPLSAEECSKLILDYCKDRQPKSV